MHSNHTRINAKLNANPSQIPMGNTFKMPISQQLFIRDPPTLYSFFSSRSLLSDEGHYFVRNEHHQLCRVLKYPLPFPLLQISARSLLRSNIRALPPSLKYPRALPFTQISALFPVHSHIRALLFNPNIRVLCASFKYLLSPSSPKYALSPSLSSLFQTLYECFSALCLSGILEFSVRVWCWLPLTAFERLLFVHGLYRGFCCVSKSQCISLKFKYVIGIYRHIPVIRFEFRLVASTTNAGTKGDPKKNFLSILSWRVNA